MAEGRKEVRKKVGALLVVFDLNNDDEALGSLINVSHHGFLLTSKELVEVDRVWQLMIKLPYEINHSDTIKFGAESLWNDTAMPSQFWTGFQIVDIAQDERNKINQLVEESPD